MVICNRPVAVLLACYLLMIAWVTLAVFALLFILYASDNSEILNTAFKTTLIVVVIAALSYVLLALRLHCPACNRRFLLQTPGPKHPSVRSLIGLDYWATSAMEVVLRGMFTCMYCGEKCIVPGSPFHRK